MLAFRAVGTLGAGTMVTPSVRLVAPLGAGGMGAVWLADHLTLRTRVVVKVISGDILTDEMRMRFSREAASAAAVKSPHVVQMLDHGVFDGVPFIVMELLDGEDLRKRLDRARVLPVLEVDAIVEQTAKALAAAHRAGVVHRDIKPDNLFLCKTEEREMFVKLLDFGVAKTNDALDVTHTGAVVGTPYYMSPEQVRGERTDLRTDLWSLGVVAFEALTGTRAFDGASLGALALAIIDGSLPRPSQRNASLPRSIDAWFARACARAASERFASAKELALALHAAVIGMGETATAFGGPRSSSWSTVPARPSRAGAYVVGGVATAVLVAGGAIALYGTMHREQIASSAPVVTTTTTPPPIEHAHARPVDSATITSEHASATASAPTAPIAIVRPVAPVTRPSASVSVTKPDCTTPWFLDDAGIRVFKKECLH
jgi:serine/threonine-protein kinase